MTSILPPSVSSTQDLTSLILEIRSYAKWYSQYTTASKVKTTYKEAQPELSPTATELIRTWGKQSPLSQKSLDELISTLEKTVSHAPIMTITLAAPATTEVKRALVDWCRSNIHQDILVTFRFNSTILGGMVVRFGSKIYDWSFRRAILNERHKFGEMLTRV
jgi:hypothetical protein